jgi:hypothetical protein
MADSGIAALLECCSICLATLAPTSPMPLIVAPRICSAQTLIETHWPISQTDA